MKLTCAERLNFLTKDVALIITGCIRPRTEQRFLVLQDVDERLRQYIESINFWITSSPFVNIVFCDNSAYPYGAREDIVMLAQEHGKTFEWLSFQGNEDKVLECGKGYGEGEIIEYALENSQLLQQAKYFAKVTGRLIIQNIQDVVKDTTCGRNYFNRDIYHGHGIDTRFYLCECSFYKQNLAKLYEQTNELPGQEKSIEDLFWPIVYKNYSCRSTMAYPAFIGHSGGNGIDYSKTSGMVIDIYSTLCRLNLFNTCYAVVLGFKKLQLILSAGH